MAENYAGEITFKLKADVDEKSVSNASRKIANNSKIALQKEVKDLDSAVLKSLQALRSDVEQMDQTSLSDVFTRAAEAVKIFNNRVAEIEKSDSIDSVTAKLYKLEQKLESSARNVLDLKKDFDALQQTNRGKDNLIAVYGSLDEAKRKIQELRTEADALNRAIGEGGALKFDTEFKVQMQEQAQEMDNLRNKIRELKAERDSLSKSGSAGTPEMSKELEQLNTEIAQATSRLGTLSKEFYAVGRQAGLGKTNADIKEMFNNWTRMEQLYNEANRIAKVFSDIKKAGGNAAEVFSKLSNAITNFDEATAKIFNMDEALNKVAEDAGKVNDNVKGTSASFNDWRVVGFSLFRVLGSINTIASDIARSARRIVNFFKQLWNIAKKIAGAFKNIGKSIKGTADEHSQSFKKMLKDVIRYSLGIRSLFMLFRRLRKYIKEAFTEMANQIPAVNSMLAGLKSSLYGLKGSLATAFEPILSKIAPALVQLIDLLAQAVTYIGMFFAALTGRGFVYKANKVAQTIGKAAGAAKELNKQLQGFDELNNLTTNQGGGGGAESPLAQFEKVDVPDWIENLAKKLKNLWNDLLEPIKKAWDAAGKYVVDAWKRAFTSVKDLLSDIVRDFVRAWKSGLGEIIALRFFQIIGDVGHIVANIADALRRAWNYNDNGYKIWVAILQIVEKVLTGVQKITADIKEWTKNINLTPAMTAFREWLESLVPIAELVMNILYDIYHDALKPILNWAFDGENSGVAIFFRILKKFNDELNMSKIREDLDKIWSAIGRFGQTVGEGLLIFMNKMLGYLKDWLNSDDFTKWCEDVAAWLDSIEPADIAEDLEQVWRILKNVAEWVWKIIKYVIDNKDVILDTLETASEHLDAIAAVFLGGKLLTDIGRFLINLAVFGGSLGKLFGAGGIVAGGTKTVQLLGVELAGWVGTLASLVTVLAAVAGGYALAIKANESLTPVLEENQKKVDSLKASMDDTIPTYDEMSQAARDASRNQKEYAEKMQDMYDTLLKTHPELKNLKDALEENGYKIGNNVDRLIQINDGFKVFNASGGDVKTTLSILAEKYGQVDHGAALFFNKLADGNEKCAEVKESVDKYNATLEETKKKTEEAEKVQDNYIKTYTSEKEVLADVQKGHDNVVGSYKTHWDIVNKNKDAVQQNTEANKNYMTSNDSLNGSLDGLTQAIEDLTKIFGDLKGGEGDVVDYTPEFTGAMENMQTAMDETGQKADETGNNIVAGIKKPLQTANFDSEARNTYSTLFKALEFAFGIASPAKKMEPIGNYILLGIVEGFKNKYDDFKRSIQEFYNNTVKPWFDKSKWTFDGVAQGLRETFEKVKDYIRTPINDTLGFIEKFVNGIIDGFNSLGSKLGDFDFDIPDKLAEKFNLPTEFKLSLPKLNRISIPRLAQGAVIPPNKEFLAVLGDQKSGTNIESPLSTMVEAFNMANKGGNEQELALLQEQNDLLRQLLQKEFGISERQIFNSVVNQNSIYRKSTGISAFT